MTTVQNNQVQTTVPTIVPRGAGRLPAAVPEGFPHYEIKLDAQAGAGFSLIEYIIPARFAPPPVLHRHTHESATGYVVEGEVTYWFEDGSANVLGPGALVHLPAGAWFRWANRTDHPARVVFVFRPAGFEQFFVEVLDGIAAAGDDKASIGSVLFPLRDKYGDEQYPA